MGSATHCSAASQLGRLVDVLFPTPFHNNNIYCKATQHLLWNYLSAGAEIGNIIAIADHFGLFFYPYF